MHIHALLKLLRVAADKVGSFASSFTLPSAKAYSATFANSIITTTTTCTRSSYATKLLLPLQLLLFLSRVDGTTQGFFIENMIRDEAAVARLQALAKSIFASFRQSECAE